MKKLQIAIDEELYAFIERLAQANNRMIETQAALMLQISKTFWEMSHQTNEDED
jgi:hypothetical protein